MNNKHREEIPDRKKCLALMERYKMLPNIRRHSFMVCEVALSIAKELNEKGGTLNINRVIASALLHDITKTRSLKTGENHAETGAQLLSELGYKKTAAIVREHITPKDGTAAVTEGEVISYADKRVMHDKVVSLDERFDYLITRYGSNEQAVNRINNSKKIAKKIEEKLLKKITVSLDDTSNELY